MRGFTWAGQSKFTDPGAAGAVIDALPADLAVLREASSQLVFHYRADGDWAENGVPGERAGTGCACRPPSPASTPTAVPRARSRSARDAAAAGLGGCGRGWRLARHAGAGCGRPTAEAARGWRECSLRTFRF